MARGLELKIPPLILGVLTAALMWGAEAAMPEMQIAIPATAFWALGLAVPGLALCVSGVVSFVLAKTTVNPMSPASSSSLVVAGIYRYTRNPMYLGMLLLLLGWAAFLANLTALAGVPVFVLYMNRYQIAPEERALTTLFPSEFPKYCATVRRWV